ncbi:MAG: YeeE/YedE family protein [Polyangiales bacterium]
MDIPGDWIRALEGGALIGIAASLMLAFNGRVTGISGIVGGLLSPTAGDVMWRALFVAGLLAGGALALAATPAAFTAGGRSLATIGAAGVLVGFGTRVGNGCTSGHGVCGISRLSPRSLAATMTFISAGAITVLVTRAVSG